MTSFTTRIDDPSQTAEARSSARLLATGVGFDEIAAEKVCLIVTEASTNLLKHAGGGQLLVRTSDHERHTEIEVLALDTGPGIYETDVCWRDGYSTGGTMGTGLGAIARLSKYCDVYSQLGHGAVLLARIAPSASSEHAASGKFGVVQTAKPGQEICGDQWGMQESRGQRILLLADGLGHGPEAAKAGRAAVDILHRYPDLEPQELIEAVHQALRSTRGAAVAAAKLDVERQIVTFAGLGNISGSISAPGDPVRHMVSNNGTAGVEARHIREFTYPWPEGAPIVLHSDGIGTHWSLREYPGLAARDPGLIAGVIYRDHCRWTDDATILVCT